MLRIRAPPCEPKDLGRGDIFRVNASLFDYTVLSTWNTTKMTSGSQVQNQERVPYQGQSFATCSVQTVQFDYSLLDNTQTITVGVICPGTPEYPVYVSMETKMVFAWLLSKDFVGQYYGVGLNLPDPASAEANNYRTLAFAALEAISTDSLTIMRGKHLSNYALSISVYLNTTFINGIIYNIPLSSTVTYINGSDSDWPAEADIYVNSIYNLVNVAAHTVNLDLGSAGPESIYSNRTAMNQTIVPNLAPKDIAPADWAEQGQSFYYGNVTPPYQTWAQMILAGQTISLGNVTGLPSDSNMVASYICPSYQLKPIGALLTALFVGTATMLSAAWAVWIYVSTFWARSYEKPCLDCVCPQHQPMPSSKDRDGDNSSLRTWSTGVDDEKADLIKRPRTTSWFSSGTTTPNRLSYVSYSTVGEAEKQSV